MLDERENRTNNFPNLVEQLAATLVLVEPGDLQGFQKALEVLQTLESHPISLQNPQVADLLKRIRERIEDSIMETSISEGRMKEIEEAIKTLQDPATLEGKGETPPPSPNEPKERASATEAEGESAGEIQTEGPELDQDISLYTEFISEAKESLDSIEVHILALEEDPENVEEINGVFRPFHTIKGVSGFLNLTDINKLAHEVENLLDKARNGELKMGPMEIDLILDAVDLMKKLIDSLEARLDGRETVDHSQELKAFLERLKDPSLAVSTIPPFLKEPSSVPPLGEILINQEKIEEKDLEECLNKQITEQPEKKLGEILVEEKKASPKDVIEALRIQKEVKSAGQVPSLEKSSQMIKVNMQRLDNLVDMVGELVIAQSLILQHPRIQALRDHQLTKNFGQLSRITSELQKTAMSMRMVPIKQTFQKMIRLVRDLSKRSEKPINLTMSGEDTEIDRNMVDAIYDPLVHLIRNAVDHGIEPPEIRVERGKSKTGHIHLSAYHRAGNVVIEIQDDGRGLDKERILKKARERGLVGPDDLLSDQEIYNLIFQPGFSTADEVTDVSGRGVGMDVVQKTIEGLRGKVEIHTQTGQGSTFVIKLPLTLAIIEGMLVQVGTERYVLPTMNIRESFKPKKEHYSTVSGQGEIVRVRDRFLPLIRLSEIFGTQSRYNNPWEGLVIVIESEGELRCLMVDDVLGKQEVVIKSLGESLRNIKGISGGAILGDGRVGLILDVHGLFQLYDGMTTPVMAVMGA